ncbi:hypothetical protein QBC40DRAFT_249765 [Triangularia verruculosa]|uniref:Uncharacterized protein n=1 Tax=Triangularia verruculosa TaxID=2587418 RepID=A0AAN6XPS0_9PEZI|nr:hypothetical protein QBC40DRAFT_249765 [Triangularia verruculosa]
MTRPPFPPAYKSVPEYTSTYTTNPFQPPPFISLTAELNYLRHLVTQNFLNQCIICPYLAYLPIEPKAACPLCLNMVKFMTSSPHSLDSLRKLARISEVFHWEEFVCLLNDAIIERVSDTLGIGPEKDVVYLSRHFRRMMWPKTEEQMVMTEQGKAWFLEGDVGVVYEKAMLRRGVFGRLGLSIGEYEIIHG